MRNADHAVVEDFGDEWSRFDQTEMPDEERRQRFAEYFAPFPWERLPPAAVGFDAGCGSGRWAVLLAPRVGHLHCVDPSSAIDVAKRNLAHLPNCSFHRTTVDEMPLADDSMDFGYSLGVLHHVPDTQQGLNACVRKLKRGAPFLVYLYYAFDNRPAWFRALWWTSDRLRRIVSRLPSVPKRLLAEGFAATVYWPLARTVRILERAGVRVDNYPLFYYRDKSFYTMRTDALDRFGTRFERRFTRAEVEAMLQTAGLEDIRFSEALPFWCAAGVKK